jgi:serine protease Do
MKGEHISHPWLGVYIQDLTQDVATAYGYNGTSGVVVRSVISGGPAAAAGLQEGDIITGWNGTPVADMDDLLLKVQQAGVGAKINLTIWRDKQSVTASVTLTDQPSS